MNILDFFAPSGKFPPTGTFSTEHIIMSSISFAAIIIALICTRKLDHKKVKSVIRFFTIVLCVLEIAKITFNLITGHISDLNSYIPLYFCSIMLYAGLLASFAKGWWKRTGEVFLATGGVIGGLCYIVYPLTSVTIYPPIHFITFHSFILHSIMVYVGLLALITGYVKLMSSDIDHYFFLISLISVLAFSINILFHTNLMFLSQNYPGTFLEVLYNIFPGLVFPLFMYLVQATLPFYAVFLIYWLITKNKNKEIA